ADGGYISKETTLELLQRGGILPIDFDVEAEVLGLDGSDQRQLESQLERDRLLLEQGIMAPPQALQPGS
ncbi:MAG: hypothetical protein EBU42_10870, partial [Synechococcus sp.]|nr:hypothetical protein [Synechococcus sp.]